LITVDEGPLEPDTMSLSELDCVVLLGEDVVAVELELTAMVPRLLEGYDGD
jgi:hypothetical protein